MTPVEAIHLSLTDIEKHLANAVEAVTQHADNMADFSGVMENQRKATKDLADTVMGLDAEVKELNTLLRQYVDSTNKLRSEVREKLRAV